MTHVTHPKSDPLTVTDPLTHRPIACSGRSRPGLYTMHLWLSMYACVSGAVVGQVSAVDLDSPPYDSFTYRLRRDDPDSIYFRVDGETGSIQTAVPLDRERRRMYRMSVIAQSDTVRRTVLYSTMRFH